MNSLTLSTGVTLSGIAIGTAANSGQTSSIVRSLPATLTNMGSGATLASNIIDRASVAQTLAAGGTVAIDLTSFNANPFAEAAQTFATVRVIYIEHSTGSSSSGISAFNAIAGNSFQGPLSAGASITLTAGGNVFWRSSTVVGWVVSSTTKNFYIVNNDGVNAATIRYLVAGS